MTDEAPDISALSLDAIRANTAALAGDVLRTPSLTLDSGLNCLSLDWAISTGVDLQWRYSGSSSILVHLKTSASLRESNLLEILPPDALAALCASE